MLVNYSEDTYRQRFTAAHEGGHGIIDRGDDVIVTFKGQKKELVEMRANTFASRYLLPPEVMKQIPVGIWNRDEIVKWASQFKVSTHALAIALKRVPGVVNDRAVDDLRQARVPGPRQDRSGIGKLAPAGFGEEDGPAGTRTIELLRGSLPRGMEPRNHQRGPSSPPKCSSSMTLNWKRLASCSASGCQ